MRPTSRTCRRCLTACGRGASPHRLWCCSGCDTADVRRHRRRPIRAGLRRLVGGGQARPAAGRRGGRALPGRRRRTAGDPEQYYFFYNEQQVWRSRRFANVLAVGWLALVVLAGLGGTLFARRTLAPVAQASNAARSLAEGLLDTRLPVASDDEFGAWAAAFNDMAAALEAKIGALAEAQERERRFTANVAHDLRSPLTALIGEAGSWKSRPAPAARVPATDRDARRRRRSSVSAHRGSA